MTDRKFEPFTPTAEQVQKARDMVEAGVLTRHGSDYVFLTPKAIDASNVMQLKFFDFDGRFLYRVFCSADDGEGSKENGIDGIVGCVADVLYERIHGHLPAQQVT